LKDIEETYNLLPSLNDITEVKRHKKGQREDPNSATILLILDRI
jgi:hypothetical protein